VRSSKPLKTYIHIKSFPMEVAVDSNIPQGFDMDDGAAAPIYRPNDIPAQKEVQEDQEEEPQPIYYEIPMPKQQEHSQPEVVYQQAPPQDTVFGNIRPIIWMVIVFVAFILGFFMGMGASGRNSGSGQAAPIILTSGRGG
jgi:hypothetical protein